MNETYKKNTAVVILNWNGRQFLEIFLPMLVSRTSGATIYVADNNSSDDSLAFLRENFPQVGLIELDDNYGYTGGYNRALAQIEAKYFLLLNSDIEVAEGWLEPLEAIMESDPKIAAVQPKILSFAEKTRFEYAGASGGFIDALGYPFCRGRFIGAQTEFDNGQYDNAREIFWASGAALMIRSDVYSEMGGLDENFFAHMEEIDLCWRVKRAGYKVMVEPKSTVYHVGGGTLPVWSPTKTYLNFRNNIAMLYKNQSKLRFSVVYTIRIATDSLRFASYLIPLRWSFAAAIFRGHRDFWRMRKKLDRKNNLSHKMVSQTYKGSIILRQIFISKTFGKMMTLLFLCALMMSCGSTTPTKQNSSTTTTQQTNAEKTPIITAKVVKKLPHDPKAYTQGLLLHEGKLYESTGEYGRSSLRIVDPQTGKVEKKVDLSKRYFGEGLELLNGKLYQLTWENGECFVYDPRTLNQTAKFNYRGEGWGLATDGKQLYMSNGSNVITVRNPETFEEIKRIGVHDSQSPVDLINEMEWIEGKIWANIYFSNLIAVIDPQTGKIEKYIDLSDLEYQIGNKKTADVLNGIAYDKTSKQIYVTGKNWDTLFEITLN